MSATHWECHKCHGWALRGGKPYCNSCGHSPPAGVTEKRGGPPAKGADSAPAPKAGASGKAEAKAAAGQQQAVAIGGFVVVPGSRKERKAAMREAGKLAALEAENKKLRTAAAEPKADESAAAVLPQAAGAAMELDHDGTVAGASALEAAVSAARAELKQTKALTDFQKSLVPDYDAAVLAAQAKVEAAVVARRAAHPLRKQLEVAEGHKQRTSKRIDEAKVLLETRRKEVANAQAAAQLQEKTLADLEAVLAKAAEEVANLAARFAAERNAAPAAPAAGGAAPQTVGPAAGPPEGFVSVAVAEALWNEREQQIQKNIAEAVALATSDRSNSVASSEAAASDVADIDSLEAYQDDEKWNKVGKDRRKAVLSKQKDILAAKVSRSLAKVSVTESPFCKKAKLAA